MEKQIDKNVEAQCRACLELLHDDPCCVKHDIFITPDLAKKLIVCTSLTVEAQDGFPRYLCDCCFNKLNEFHEFQSMCVESVQRFRDILQRQGETYYEFVDEKPDFDLEEQAKMEMTIAETNVMLRTENYNNTLADELELEVLEAVPFVRRSGRKSKQTRITEKVVTVVKREEKCGRTNKRSKKLNIDLSGEESKEAKPQEDMTKDALKSYSDHDAKPQLDMTRDTSKSDSDHAAMPQLDITRDTLKIDTDQDVKTQLDMTRDTLKTDSDHDAWSTCEEFESLNTHEHMAFETKKQSQSLNENKMNANKVTQRVRRKRRLRKLNGASSDSESKTARKKCEIYQCDMCPARFFVEHRLVAHKRTHDGLMGYPCSVEGCNKAFNRWHCLNAHLKQHAGTSKWFKCSEVGCDKVYKHKPTLSMHLRKFHKKGPELKSHVCEICGKVFKASAILNDHRYTHKDKSELPHACPEPNCDRRFSSKEKLKVHGMRHAGIKNFVCTYCGLRKTTRNELKIHINYHTLERTWPCRFCQHVCNSAGNLKMHVRTVHERAKDYACRFCERSFAKPDTRKYHEMTHTGEKPNECKECGKRFTQPAALRTHSKIHTRHRSQVVVRQAAAQNGVDGTPTECSNNNNINNSSGILNTAALPVTAHPRNADSEAEALETLHLQNLLQDDDL